MNTVIPSLMIETAPDVPGPDAESVAASRARRRAEHDLARGQAGPGARVLHRLVCTLAGERS